MVQRATSLRPPSGVRRRGRAGFLLVEALATMAIGAAILVGLASIVGLLLRTTDQVAARVEATEQTDRTVAALMREIRSLTRATWSGDARRTFVFAGESGRIMFARGIRRAGNGPSEIVVAIQSVDAKGSAGGRLLYAEAPLVPGVASVQDLRFGPVRSMHDGSVVIRFAYFGRTGEGGGEVLVDDWPSGAGLPSAVRIGIIDLATRRLLRSVRVPILIEAEPGCAAPDTAFCSRVDLKKRAPTNALAPLFQSGRR